MINNPALSAKRSAAVRRAVKFMLFSVIGALLANAAAIAAFVLLNARFDPALVSVGSMVVGSAAAGIQKAISWQDMGMDAPAESNVPSLQMPYIPPVGAPPVSEDTSQG